MAITPITEIFGVPLTRFRLVNDNHVGVITLHNPPVNTLDGAVQEELIQICNYINQDDHIHVAVLWSDLKYFSVGVDVKRFHQSVLDRDVTNVQERYYDGALALYQLRVPLICAVHGYCLGGGLCYFAGADIGIAAEGTLLGVPEARLSVVGGSGHLARILPPLIYRDMCYNGTLIQAEELVQYGGVTKVVPQEELFDTAMAKARELLERGPLLLRYLKACLNEQEDFQMHRKNQAEVTYTRYMARHEDFNEALTAFLEKREATFTGK